MNENLTNVCLEVQKLWQGDRSPRCRQEGQDRNKDRETVFEMYAGNKMRIEVTQLPPVSSSPNWRENWGEKYKDSRVYHAAVYYCCVDVRNRGYLAGMSFPFIKARLNLTFVFAEQRRRDRDNCLASFKPGLDAIVDAALILDDDAEHLEIGKVDILVDPERAPLTVIDLEQM